MLYHGCKTLHDFIVKHVIIELGERDIVPNIRMRVCATALLDRYCTRSPQQEQMTLREMCDHANDIMYFDGYCLEELCFNRFVSIFQVVSPRLEGGNTLHHEQPRCTLRNTAPDYSRLHQTMGSHNQHTRQVTTNAREA